MQIVSEDFLLLGLDDPSDISDAQLTLLDVDLDKRELWFDLAIDKNISDARAELFVLLKDIRDKSVQDSIITNYKALQKFRKVTTAPTTPPASTVKKSKKAEDITPVHGDVTIYCDGGCSPNPGASGSGVAIYRNGKVSELWYGLHESNGTNNTAELNALYESLLIAQRESKLGNKVVIKCDSMYSINCIQTWAISWERNGWKKKGGEIKNLEIIQKAYALYNKIKSKIELSHIKAHAGLEGNELADRMTIHTRDTKESGFVKYTDVIDVQEILSMRSG